LSQRQSKECKSLENVVPHHPLLDDNDGGGDGGGGSVANDEAAAAEAAAAAVAAALSTLLPQTGTKVVDVWPAAFEAPRLIKAKKLMKSAEPDPNPPPLAEDLAEEIRRQGPLLVPLRDTSGEDAVTHRWATLSEEEKEIFLMSGPYTGGGGGGK